MEEFILIDNDKDVLRVELRNSKGKTGKYWQFDLEDIELPLRVSEMFKETKDNENWVKAKMIAIDKKQDEPYDDMLTKNKREQIILMKEYYEKQMKVLNKVLGETGIEDFLEVQGRKPYYSMHIDIAKKLDELKPMLDKNLKSVQEAVKKKYSLEDNDVLQ